MNKNNFDRAKEIEISVNKLKKIRNFVSVKYPAMFGKGKTGIRYRYSPLVEEVCFESLDEESCDELKKLIHNYVDGRIKILTDEFNNL